MSALKQRENAILPVTGTDLSAKQGYIYKADAAGGIALNDSTTVAAMAVVLDGEVAAKQSSLGILGAIEGTVLFKASGAGKKYDRLAQAADGTVIKDPGAGTARVVIGVACEDFAAGDLFEGAPLAPMIGA
jgi:hypothetical protein